MILFMNKTEGCNLKKRLFLFILAVILSVIGTIGATPYYVSNEGSDDATGTSRITPWKSIARINTKTFIAGDSIHFRKGDIWREELLIKSSGTKTAPIVYTTYGEGAKPRIFGSNRAQNWTPVEGHPNIWQSGNDNSDKSFIGSSPNSLHITKSYSDTTL